jgi:hypothetical protein
MILLTLFEIFAFGLFWSCFCRSAHTSKANTKRDIRWAFTILGVVAIVCMVAPLWGYEPDGLVVLVLAAATITQLVTAHHWRAGVPRQFRRDAP